MDFAFSVCIVKEFKSSGCAGLMCLPNWIFYVSQWLQYGHPVLVPIIYGLRDKEFQRTVVKGLLCLCCKNPRLPNKRDDVKSLFTARDSRSDIIWCGCQAREPPRIDSA